MGDVIVVLNVMPKSVNTDLDKLKSAIRSAIPTDVKLNAIQTKPIAFGLSALAVSVIMKDEPGGPDRVINALTLIEDIESVEVTDLSLL
jgi:elongation factor 1-beta